ncbi:MAG: hypothetical protein K2R98_13535 [Gemmataceae bacterium]|nr:hypothetical protein [Gemmataceae bacterium]
MRWMIAPICLCALFATSGCVPLYYAYPTVSYIPEVPLDKTLRRYLTDESPILVFRIDIKDDQNTAEFTEDDRYVLRDVQPATHYFSNIFGLAYSYVPSQMKLTLDSGMYWHCVALCYRKHSHHTMRLRLYRSGYQLIQIKPGDRDVAFPDWVEAADPTAQEKAVDDLLSTAETDFSVARDKKLVTNTMRNLAPGSASAEHREALRFAAGEYERLAGENMGQVALEMRCRAKAAWLRELADK